MKGGEVVSGNELYQCPYEPACKCDMSDPCLGCEEFRPIKLKDECICQIKFCYICGKDIKHQKQSNESE